MVDVIDDLREGRMGGIHRICQRDQPWLEHGHPPVIDPIHDLYLFELLNQVEDVVEVDHKGVGVAPFLLCLFYFLES
jgi:hypothetical protein